MSQESLDFDILEANNPCCFYSMKAIGKPILPPVGVDAHWLSGASGAKDFDVLFDCHLARGDLAPEM
jgi:hypothetical protein